MHSLAFTSYNLSTTKLLHHTSFAFQNHCHTQPTLTTTTIRSRLLPPSTFIHRGPTHTNATYPPLSRPASHTTGNNRFFYHISRIQSLSLSSSSSSSPSSSIFSSASSDIPPTYLSTPSKPQIQRTIVSSFSHALRVISELSSIAKGFWTHPKSSNIAILFSALAILFSFLNTLYSVMLSFVQRLFWTALSSKNPAKFKQLLGVYAIAVVIGPLILVVFEWSKKILALHWRSFITQRYMKDYMTNRNFYKAANPHIFIPINENARDSDRQPIVDNPDQRIAEDIRVFTEKSVNLFCTIVVSILDFFIFSLILWKIHPPLYLLLILYSATGIVITLYFGKKLVGINSAQLSKEADFRYLLARIRENAESIAFYRGEAREKKKILDAFYTAFANAILLTKFQRNLGFFTTAFKYLIQITPGIVLAPTYFKGQIELGIISQGYFSFNHVLNDLGFIVSEFSNLSEFSAVVSRLYELEVFLTHNSQVQPTLTASDLSNENQDSSTRIVTTINPNPYDTVALRVENLSISSPNLARKLAQNVNLVIENQQRLLVIGESGIGKSSLMRAITGLWTTGSGTVIRPIEAQTFFLPQKPYITLGSLRDNLTYPIENPLYDDVQLLDALNRVNLPYLVERSNGLDTVNEFSTILSLGEQQRLAFARLILFRPRFVICDESTSALDVENEERMYNLLKQYNIACLSVGNRPSLLKYHEKIIRLLPDGKWTEQSPRDVIM